MRRTALHDYLSQIEGLLDENRLPEAAAHCHFVLQQYPRHIDTYRLFGRALLEQQLFDEATDVFERLLSADPEDLISHAGLALAYNENRDLERAIWHMERSFEIDPYNRAVQDELKKLYIRRDGDVSPRLSLTRAALGRLHLRAALYRPAIVEFTRLLDETPERVDLQLALADTLYWDSRRVEAAELCQQILVDLPYCIKANAILADAWLRGDRVDEAREHLRRVQALTLLDRAHLDPDTTLGRALSNSRIQLPETVQVEVLDESQPTVQGLDEVAAWQNQLTAVVIDGEQVPDWLLEVGSPEAELQAEVVPEPEAEPEDIMDWLEEAAVAEFPDPVVEPDLDHYEENVAAGEEEPLPEPDRDTAVDEMITAAVAEEFLDDIDKEASEPGEPWLMTPDAVEAVADRTEAIPAAGNGGVGEPVDSIHSDSTEQAVVQEKDEATSAPWDDESLMALDDLRSYIEAEDVSADANASPEWLGELADGSEVADELPDWLYEAVGLDATAPRIGEDEIPGRLDEDSRDADELGDAQIDRLDLEDDGVLAEVEIQDTGRDEAPADLELAGQTHGSEIPDWLLTADDVLEELPVGLVDDSKSSHSETNGLEEETAIWLDELAEQLGEFNDNPAAPAQAQDE